MKYRISSSISVTLVSYQKAAFLIFLSFFFFIFPGRRPRGGAARVPRLVRAGGRPHQVRVPHSGGDELPGRGRHRDELPGRVHPHLRFGFAARGQIHPVALGRRWSGKLLVLSLVREMGEISESALGSCRGVGVERLVETDNQPET